MTKRAKELERILALPEKEMIEALAKRPDLDELTHNASAWLLRQAVDGAREEGRREAISAAANVLGDIQLRHAIAEELRRPIVEKGLAAMEAIAKARRANSVAAAKKKSDPADARWHSFIKERIKIIQRNRLARDGDYYGRPTLLTILNNRSEVVDRATGERVRSDTSHRARIQEFRDRQCDERDDEIRDAKKAGKTPPRELSRFEEQNDLPEDLVKRLWAEARKELSREKAGEG